MSTRPRNPRYFPRMKARGARRRQQAPVQWMMHAFDGLASRAEQAARALEFFNRRYLMGAEHPAIVHQFDSGGLSPAPTIRHASDTPKPAERR